MGQPATTDTESKLSVEGRSMTSRPSFSGLPKLAARRRVSGVRWAVPDVDGTSRLGVIVRVDEMNGLALFIHGG